MLILIGILFGAALALAYPEPILWLRPVLQPGFAATMFFVGTLVRPQQVRTFAKNPARTLVGLLTQYTVMPLTAWAISFAFDDPMVRVGIILVGCMPGAMASNVMTLLFRGDLILSVTMTTVATLTCPLILAFWLPLLADTRFPVPVASLAWSAVWMVVLPVAAGIVTRHLKAKNIPHWWDRTATIIASVSIVLIILVVVAGNRPHLTNIGPTLAAAMVGLNLSGYSLAFAAAKLLRWPAEQRRTLVIEVGMQNAGLGSVLALTHLGEAGAVPSAFYTVLCVVTAALALPLSNRVRSSNTQRHEIPKEEHSL